jgi:hypothetical protein
VRRQGVLDDLGERREDRVGQVGDDQPDEPGARLPEAYGTLVTGGVEHLDDGLPGRRRDSRLAVEDPADRGLTHSGLGGDVRQARAHALESIVAARARTVTGC